MSDSKPEGHKRWEFVISLVALMGSAASFLWSNHQDQKLEAEVFDRVDKALQNGTTRGKMSLGRSWATLRYWSWAM